MIQDDQLFDQKSSILILIMFLVHNFKKIGGLLGSYLLVKLTAFDIKLLALGTFPYLRETIIMSMSLPRLVHNKLFL